MALIASIDGPNRRILLDITTVGTTVNPIDIYKEMRSMRRLDENLRKFDIFLQAKGNDAKGSGKFTERYVIALLGTRIVPYDSTQELTINGTIITDDGQEGVAVFDRTPLSPTVVVDINYVPPQVEVVRAEAELAALLQSAFNNVIVYDEIYGLPGTGNSPDGLGQIGTHLYPSNNITDTVSIGLTHGIKTIFILGTANIGSSIVLNGWSFEGNNSSISIISFTNTALQGASFNDICIFGSIIGSIFARQCEVRILTNIGGNISNTFFDNCYMADSINLIATNSKRVNFVNCSTTTEALIDIDVNNSPGHISLLGHQCRIQFKNVINTTNIHISGKGMELFLDTTVNGGNWEVHGGVSFTNNATSVLSLDDDSTANLSAKAVWAEQLEGILSAADIMRLKAAVIAGKVSGFDTLQPIFLAAGGTKPRIAATVDNNGNRTAVTLDASP